MPSSTAPDAFPAPVPEGRSDEDLRAADRIARSTWLGVGWAATALLTATQLLLGGMATDTTRVLAWLAALGGTLALRQACGLRWSRLAQRGEPTRRPALADSALALCAACLWGLPVLCLTTPVPLRAELVPILVLQCVAMALALPALAPGPRTAIATAAAPGLVAMALIAGRYGLAGWPHALAAGAAAVVFVAAQLLANRLYARGLAGRAQQREGARQLAEELSQATLLIRRFGAQAVEHEANIAELLSSRDAAEEAARSKAVFLANMSHEIRTPLNGAMGMAELMLGTDLSQKQRHFARAIHRSTEALQGLINDILDLSTIEAGRMNLRAVPLDVRQIIEEVGIACADRAERAGVNLLCAFAPTEHAIYRGDPERLRQILANLVGSALRCFEAGDGGEIALRAGVARQSRHHALLRFEVRIGGLDSRRQPRDLEALCQVDGAGLGLTLSRRLVALMDGEMGLDSMPAAGSTFWFTCPLEIEQSLHLGGPALPPGLLSGRRVLVADPGDTSRQLLAAQCAAWGMQVEFATEARSALQRLERAAAARQPFDVMLFDRRISRDGLQFAAAVRNHPPLRATALVMLVSVGNLEETGQWLNSGIGSILNKPVRQAELYEGIVEALGVTPVDVARANVEQARAPTRRLRGHVLLVEDNPVNQELARGMLERAGCRVSAVQNGREAVSAVAASLMEGREHYDLVLMDCQMPEMDGYAATRAIREAERVQGSRLPILALTASALDGDRERCLAAGMDDHLAKPYTQLALEHLVASWLPSAVSAGVDAAPRGPDKPEAMTRLVRLYLENARRLLDAVHEAATGSDRAALLRAAQTLQSTSTSVGAHDVAELCRTLLTTDADDSRAITLSILDFEFERACATLRGGTAVPGLAPPVALGA